MKTLKNLTPHAVTVLCGEREWVFQPEGPVARVRQYLAESGELDGIRVVTGSYGEIVGLPDADRVCGYCGCTDCPMLTGAESICTGNGEQPTRYIVSAIVRAAAPGRQDLYSPADLIRDAEGRIIGCGALEGNP